MTPDGWRLLPLVELLADDTPGFWGSAPTGSGDIAVLRATNLRKAGIQLDLAKLAVRSFPAKKIEQKRLQPGDIVLERSGGGPQQPVGRVALFEEDGDYAFSNFMQRLRADSGVCLSKFLAYRLSHLHATGETARLQQATTGIRNLQYKAYLALPHPTPPLPEQRKIAAILSSVDEVIEKTEAVIEQLQVVKKAMMQELLTRGLPDRHTRFKQTEIGEIPEEWEVVSLGELASFVNGRGFKSSEWSQAGSPIIRIQNLNGSLEFNFFEGEVADQHRVEPGDLLFAWSGSRGTSFGPHVWSGPQGYLNQHIFNVRTNGKTTTQFLHHALTRLTGVIEERAHGAGGLVHITKRALEAMRMPLPDRAEQEQIASCLASADERIEMERAVLLRLTGAKSALMAVLLEGEVRVTPYEEAA